MKGKKEKNVHPKGEEPSNLIASLKVLLDDNLGFLSS